MELALSSHREAWMKSLERDAGALHCSNPKCAHLVEHKYKTGDNPEFRDRKCQTFVWVDVQGRPEKRYRFQPGDHIHVACQGRFCREENQRKITFCHLVCGECMNATPIPAHLGMGGECRACLAETKDRRVTGSSEGVRGGPRDKFAEQANENSYKDAKQFEEADEEEKDKSRAEFQASATGGVAQRRAAMARVRAKRSKAAAATKAANDELELAKERLAAYEEGKTFVGEDETDAQVDLMGEDAEEAVSFWQEECDYEDMPKMREHFPQCALMWWGPVPTVEQIEDQKTKVEALEEAAETAKASYELVVREVDDDDAPIADKDGAAVDYEEPAAAAGAGAGAADAGAAEPEPAAAAGVGAAAPEADAPANAAANNQNRRRPRKALRVDEMNAEQLEKHRAERAKQAEARRKKEAGRKKMEEEYPDLVERAGKYDRAKRKIAQKNEVIGSMQTMIDEKDKRIEAEQDKVTQEVDGLIAWLNDKADKPEGWNPDGMIQKFQVHRARKQAQSAKRKRDAGDN